MCMKEDIPSLNKIAREIIQRDIIICVGQGYAFKN